MKLRDKLQWLPSPTRSPARSENGQREELDGRAFVEARVEHDEAVRRALVDEEGTRACVAVHREAAVHVETDEVDAGTRLSTLQSLRARLDAMRSPSRRVDPARSAPMRGEARALVVGEGGALTSRSFADALGSLLPATRIPAPKQVVPGERSDTPLGALYRMSTTHAPDHHHGSAEVRRALDVCPHEVSVLALEPALSAIDYRHALYIDTETTGLAGGTGTLPFLIGMAWFESEQLIVEQLVLPRPGAEGPMLARLAERIAAASVIVSYNGKSFDWPLLRTRFILNRIAAPKLPAHLDLLHCARRVYKSRLGSLRLVFLEQELMHFERIDDIPGELIPETYLSFLRGSTPGEALLPILDHNRSDLVALPALLGEIMRRFRGEHTRQDARDQLGFARVAARADAADQAIRFATAAVEADVRGQLTASAMFLVGELKQKLGELDGARMAFEASVAASTTAFDAARAHHALAKLFEHKDKCAERALRHAAETAAFEGEEACERRVARLTARLARRAEDASKTRRRARPQLET